MSVIAVPGIPESKVTFLAAFGEAVMEWNAAESVLRFLLMMLCGRGTSTYILTAELGSLGIINGLRSISDTQEPPIKEAIRAVATYYEKLRSYRNYYVHGITFVGFSPGEAIGMIIMAEAKGKYRIAEDRVHLKDLVELRDRAQLLHRAVNAILDTIDPVEGAMANPVLPTSQSLPPPESLLKTLRYPLDVQPPPAP